MGTVRCDAGKGEGAVERKEAWRAELQSKVGPKALLWDAPMSRYTTLRLGGPADMLCQVTCEDMLAEALSTASAQGIPVMLLGNGSNLLVKDGGIRGLVIQIGDGLSTVDDPLPLPDGRFALTVGAGILLSKLAGAAAAHGLTGLEFAAGIPGTVGGAVYMNAGAYGGEMKDVVTAVAGYDTQGKPVQWTGPQMRFGYRSSRLAQGEQAAICSVTVALKKDDEKAIRAKMGELLAQRKAKQPMALPSCGSTFKRPAGHFAGTLIDQCGLKGHRIGGASVSTLHAGFLVNDRQGTAADFLALIAYVQRVVLDKTGVVLEPEVRIVGEDAPAKAL